MYKACNFTEEWHLEFQVNMRHGKHRWTQRKKSLAHSEMFFRDLITKLNIYIFEKDLLRTALCRTKFDKYRLQLLENQVPTEN